MLCRTLHNILSTESSKNLEFSRLIQGQDVVHGLESFPLSFTSADTYLSRVRVLAYMYSRACHQYNPYFHHHKKIESASVINIIVSL